MADETTERMLDELVWAIDHLSSPDSLQALAAWQIIQDARTYAAIWHRHRQQGNPALPRRRIDLTEADESDSQEGLPSG